MNRPYSLLFISRRNSARSLMAEAVVNRLGKGRFRAISAGVEPAEEADPLAVDAMQAVGYGTDELRPKHWRQFTEPDAPVLDFVFTLSDSGTREAFPNGPESRPPPTGVIPISRRQKATSGRSSASTFKRCRLWSGRCASSCSSRSPRSIAWL
jgi:protein-tyrosine-phosphatase